MGVIGKNIYAVIEPADDPDITQFAWGSDEEDARTAAGASGNATIHLTAFDDVPLLANDGAGNHTEKWVWNSTSGEPEKQPLV